MKPTRVLFVCLGNICRSPTAEGVFASLVKAQRLHNSITIDSAGTGGWHIGKPPDTRAIAAARGRGYDIAHLRGRQVQVSDFSFFDYILAMDDDNLSDLQRLAPAEHSGSVSLLLPYGSQRQYHQVPDPYYGGEQSFDLVLDLIEDACAGFLTHLQKS